ncbi:uncharacterized protein LOC144716807 isoform X2 [Wolffia australiana]
MARDKVTPARKSTKRKVVGGASGRDEGQTSEYEQQRLSRIRENREKLEALKLPSLASSLLGSSGSSENPINPSEEFEVKDRNSRRGKGERSEEDGDDDYQPSEDDEFSGESSSREEDAEYEDQAPKRKGKKKISSNLQGGNETYIVGKKSSLIVMDEDDPDLQQAIALSLEGPNDNAISGKGENDCNCSISGVQEKLDNIVKNAGACGRKRKGSMKRPQMTKDDLIAFFFSFDGILLFGTHLTAMLKLPLIFYVWIKPFFEI